VKVYFGSNLSGFSPWLVDPIAFGLVGRQWIMGRGTFWSKAAHFMADIQREEEEGAGVSYTLQGHAPSDQKTSHYVSPLKVSTSFQYHHSGGQVFNTRTFGDIPDPNYSSV
jgi:hypothetical protein